MHAIYTLFINTKQPDFYIFFANYKLFLPARRFRAMEEFNMLKEMVRAQPASLAEKREVLNEHRDSAIRARTHLGCWTMMVRASVLY